MCKKNLNTILSNIMISIRYARLQEEIEDTITSKTAGSGQKKFVIFNEKVVVKGDKSITIAQREIKKIEDTYNKKSYLLLINNKLRDELKKLEKRKDFEFIKFAIGLSVVIDDTYNYSKHTKVDFVENVSTILFDDKVKLHRIESVFNKIEKEILGIKVKALMEEDVKKAGTALLNVPTEQITESLKLIPKNVLLTLGIVGAVASAGLIIFRQKKYAKKVTTLEVGEFGRDLVTSAMNLQFAKEYYDGDFTKYKKYFKVKIEEINQKRKYLLRELFDDQVNIENNELKLKLLHNYDNFLIKQLVVNPNKMTKVR